jgi:rhamnosyltransferase
MSSSIPTPAEVIVLLATRNGERWLQDQIDSILDQEGVSVRIVALDDDSSDGTRALLEHISQSDDRLTVLAPRGASGGAAANFYRLLLEQPFDDDALVAFADQDDLWVQGKLARHSRMIASEGVDGVSSNVVAFDSRGRTTLIRKDYPQRAYDFLLESPGPGSTFLMTARLANLAREALSWDDRLAQRVDYHDWLVYALCRARGWKWHIDGRPSVRYRQHDDNVMGSNVGARSAISRLGLIRRQWHRQQAGVLAMVAARIAGGGTASLELLRTLIEQTDFRSRMRLARRVGVLRRRPRDRLIMGVLIVLGIW